MQLQDHDTNIHYIIRGAPQAKDVFRRCLHFQLDCIVWGHKLDIIYIYIRLWVLADALTQNVL